MAVAWERHNLEAHRSAALESAMAARQKRSMADRLAPAARSAHMARIRRSDTKPERVVRALLHGLGYRFRTQLKGVPGRPDVGFPGRRKAIMVHGCFWHQHPGCRHARIPATRSAFWQAKFDRNRERDARLLAQAEASGWRMLVVWECETTDLPALQRRLVAHIGPTRAADAAADRDLQVASHPARGRLPSPTDPPPRIRAWTKDP